MADHVGQAHAITVICPVHPDRVEALRECLAGLGRDGASPLAVASTHFGRWVVIDKLVDAKADPASGRLSCPYLLFSSSFDGEAEPYLQALCQAASPALHGIWSHCIGYPEGCDDAGLIAYVLHNRIRNSLFFTPYPDAKVADIGRSLALREEFMNFAVKAQAMDSEALMAGFRSKFGGLAP